MATGGGGRPPIALQLSQRFAHVVASRHRFLGEVQQRARVLGDILNRLGVRVGPVFRRRQKATGRLPRITRALLRWTRKRPPTPSSSSLTTSRKPVRG